MKSRVWDVLLDRSCKVRADCYVMACTLRMRWLDCNILQYNLAPSFAVRMLDLKLMPEKFINRFNSRGLRGLRAYP